MVAEIADMNKRGIACLQRGRHEAAIICFTQAIQQAHQKHVKDFAAATVNRAEEKMAQQCCRLPLHFEIVASPDTCLEKATDCADENESIFELYARPFLIEDSLVMVMPPSVIHAALCYNVGLAYHLWGLSQNSSSVNLRLALQFYERGICVLRQNSMEEGYSSNGMYWLTLALLTNAGDILWGFWYTDEALRFRDHMRMLVEQNQIFTLPVEDIRFFVDCSSRRTYMIRNAAPAA